MSLKQSNVAFTVRNKHLEFAKPKQKCEPAVKRIGNDTMKSNAYIVREACQVIWTEGLIDRVPELYSEDFTADYAFRD